MAQQTDALPRTRRATSSDEERGEAGVLSRTKLRSTPGFYERAWHRFRQNKVSLVALGLSFLIVLFVLAAGLISEYVTGVDYADGNLRNKLAGPSTEENYLGTDANGRDLLTRLAYGGRISLRVAGLAAITILAIGGTIGAVAG